MEFDKQKCFSQLKKVINIKTHVNHILVFSSKPGSREVTQLLLKTLFEVKTLIELKYQNESF